MRLLIIALLVLAQSNSHARDKQLLWGDTHLHTTYSSDAYTNNNLTAGPETAFNYARGKPVIHPYHRARVQIETPLDFLVVSDHAELLGVIRYIHREGVITDDLGMVDTVKAKFAEWMLGKAIDKGEGRALFASILPKPMDPRIAAEESLLGDNVSAIPDMLAVEQDTWKTITDTADRYNDPGEFTALIGWEWSSIPGGANLHRVVITDSDAITAQRYQPYSLNNSAFPEDLWTWLNKISAETGAEFIAIPHNSNISKGFMFDDKSLRGTDFTDDYIADRMRWERLAEITQIKGDSETHSSLSPDDAFADFENYPYYIENGYTEYKPSAGDFVRSALKRGLALEEKTGQNPYQFGVIGSTDSHTTLSSAEEGNFWGKLATDSIPENKQTKFNDDETSSSGWAMSASGLAAVWAEANTRDAIMQAMRRREVYATTGPRIKLQFFAGARLGASDLAADDFYANASAKGIPMGGELRDLEQSPNFLIIAAKDPKDANLDRIQIVKGWLDSNGEQQEKVYDVVWSGDRQSGSDAQLPSVGNSVDITSGDYSNDIGAAQLSAVWQDPAFNPDQSAFYYVRVLQIPTPRHSLLDALALGMEHADDQPDTIQERAYSSAIWYSPK